jgi:hypothetical protein
MSEAEIGQNIVPWKKHGCVEEAGVRADEQQASMSNAAARFEDAYRILAHDTPDETHMTLTFMAGPHGELRDLQAYMSGLVEGVVRTNLRQARELFLADSPRAFIELQQRFMQEYFQAFQQGTEALIRAAKGVSPTQLV